MADDDDLAAAEAILAEAALEDEGEAASLDGPSVGATEDIGFTDAGDDFGEGADAWRFDDTKLDDLEEFLKQVLHYSFIINATSRLATPNPAREARSVP